MIEKQLKIFQKVIIISLAVMMCLAITLATAHLGLIIIKAVLKPPRFLFDVSKLLDIFGYFVLILIGIELLESFKAYLSRKEIHVEVVFTVALVALAHKILIINIKEVQGFILIGIAALVIAFSIGFYLLKRSHRENNSVIKPPE